MNLCVAILGRFRVGQGEREIGQGDGQGDAKIEPVKNPLFSSAFFILVRVVRVVRVKTVSRAIEGKRRRIVIVTHEQREQCIHRGPHSSGGSRAFTLTTLTGRTTSTPAIMGGGGLQGARRGAARVCESPPAMPAEGPRCPPVTRVWVANKDAVRTHARARDARGGP